MDLSAYYIGQLERGERQMSLPVLIKIAQTLHISLDYIIFGKVAENSALIYDESSDYNAADKKDEINDLLNSCNEKEINFLDKVIKLIIPYINKN